MTFRFRWFLVAFLVFAAILALGMMALPDATIAFCILGYLGFDALKDMADTYSSDLADRVERMEELERIRKESLT